uniref:Uncharacterized protein n=1 Tax=Rhizophora mucronata TaxID=61149 RepID=A0A2P2N6C8_RHIMU
MNEDIEHDVLPIALYVLFKGVERYLMKGRKEGTDVKIVSGPN